MKRVVVIGGGVGGLTVAAVLARAGVEVTLLEAHTYAGGCAGTFYHQGYRFDAGATLAAGFYPGGPMDLVGQATGIHEWLARPVDIPMQVHLPDGCVVNRIVGEGRIEEYQRLLGDGSLDFWRWQERTADVLWDFALRNPDWPPQSIAQLAGLASRGVRWLAQDIGKRLNPGLMLDAFRPAVSRLNGASERLRWFVDGQLLISAQTTSKFANALYAASALDLPRRGVVDLEGGMGAIAATLARAVHDNGGRLLYRKTATRIVLENGQPVAVDVKRGESIPADLLVANLTPWNLAKLIGDQGLPKKLASLPKQLSGLWGAFMLYLGLDESVIPPSLPLHHQVLVQEPFGEGNSIFLSISPEWDQGRAPPGKRAVTISTHTGLDKWWSLYENDPAGYENAKERMTEKLLDAASLVIPELRKALELVMPGTPVTFERFTRRMRGWVGGFPQLDLFRAWGPRLGQNLWLVGDSIFPGQSTAAVVLGGLRVADNIIRTIQ